MSIRLIRRLPVGVRTYPMDAAFVVLGIPTSITSLFGVSYSAALNILPVWSVKLWATVLLVGCVSWLVGIVSTRKDPDTGIVVITRVHVMLLGLSLVCIAALVYSVAVIVSAGLAGVVASLYPLSIAAGALIRRADLLARIRGVE